MPYAAIVAEASDIAARADDPVYGKAIKPTWDYLDCLARKEGRDRIVEFGSRSQTAVEDKALLAPKADAPVLMPAHLDLLSQTSPIPAADPEVALFLHGPDRQPDSISVIWRADISPILHRSEDIRRLLTYVPPRSLEATELPLWAVRRWLRKAGSMELLADIATVMPEEDGRAGLDGQKRRSFRWKGNDERSCWIDPEDLRPGDTIIVPATYGGVDDFGWPVISEVL